MPKKRKVVETPTNSLWKKESQKLKPDLSSKPARNRYWANIFIPLVVLAGFALIVWGSVFLVNNKERFLQKPIPQENIAYPALAISGNSGLPEEVITRLVHSVINGDLNSVNPFKVKEILEENGQIKEAKVGKDFPDTLVISIIERQPVLMLATMNDGNELDFWGVDEDGVVFMPFDLRRMKALDLPFLQGIDVDKIEDGITRVDGIDKVYYLLQLIKREAYPVYNDIISVSLEHYEDGIAELGATIIIRGKQLKKITFGIENFEYQVVKLIGVLSLAGKIQLDKKDIDLSYSGDAIVR